LATTSQGGLYEKYRCDGYPPYSSCGVVFELTPQENGSWQERVLHSFNFNDGSGPSGTLVFDATGNLYGTTRYGGAHWVGTGESGGGVVFQMSPKPSGGWKTTVIHEFGVDNTVPDPALVLDQNGNVYGTTFGGGAFEAGSVFQLSPGQDGKWAETILYSFKIKFGGRRPMGGLIFDSAGNLYGSAESGGAKVQGDGTVFELTP
jgi:uncharacterized repeat protein (TIGR03803 family)